MGNIMGWRTYYADGTTVDSTEAAPEQLDHGVVGVVEFLEPPYRKIVCGGDWVWWDGEHWQETDSVWNGWVDPPQDVPEKYVKRGAGLPDDEWERLRLRMVDDREWVNVD
jgi:hypothetical protein